MNRGIRPEILTASKFWLFDRYVDTYSLPQAIRTISLNVNKEQFGMQKKMVQPKKYPITHLVINWAEIAHQMFKSLVLSPLPYFALMDCSKTKKKLQALVNKPAKQE